MHTYTPLKFFPVSQDKLWAPESKHFYLNRKVCFFCCSKPSSIAFFDIIYMYIYMSDVCFCFILIKFKLTYTSLDLWTMKKNKSTGIQNSKSIRLSVDPLLYSSQHGLAFHTYLVSNHLKLLGVCLESQNAIVNGQWPMELVIDLLIINNGINERYIIKVSFSAWWPALTLKSLVLASLTPCWVGAIS